MFVRAVVMAMSEANMLWIVQSLNNARFILMCFDIAALITVWSLMFEYRHAKEYMPFRLLGWLLFSVLFIGLVACFLPSDEVVRLLMKGE